ncbi:cupredoxin family copper-binding protein [Limibaculum sp. FT325]|uniref:cupredoxin domain-containing protein n=1 Tax=Thermohalobaculum sediminis TaxID=2939436 RepID=UPI0020BFDC35|nr:cupredoxin family copper-binding protein [Limibaculum sediminis]MCL5778069.1 cupredoxin family copper-binding protein [Limibaculum sediminis]
MRGLNLPTRRRFGQGLGTALALACLPRALRAHDGAHEVEVHVARFAFEPARVEIRVGDSVTWLNRDLAPHTATADGGGWDTGALPQGAAGRITFDTAGHHSYVCAFHPHMKGAVVVRPRAGA